METNLTPNKNIKIYKSQVGITILKKPTLFSGDRRSISLCDSKNFLELNIPVQTRVIMHCLFLQNEVKY